MKLIIKEYLSLLKEDGELDSLLIDLLRAMGLSVSSKPQKGRQHGVDVLAQGIDPDDDLKKIFLFAVKQGNIDRTSWNSKVNSVKQTLDEIRDTFIQTSLTPTQLRLPKKVIVCTNGYLQQPVQMDWSNYAKKYSVADGIEIDFWSLEDIILKVERYLFNEQMLPEEMRKLISKTLAFLDVQDYDLSHFDQLLKKILKHPVRRSKKNYRKKVRLVSVIHAMIYKWSEGLNNLKPALKAGDLALLNVWDWLQTEELWSKGYLLTELYSLLQFKAEIDIKYVNKISSQAFVKDGLSRYSSSNHLEYQLIVWEQIGYISMAGLTQLNLMLLNHNQEDLVEHFHKNLYGISEILVHLIENNPSARYVYFDENGIEFIMASMVLLNGREEYLEKWITSLHGNIFSNYQLRKIFPLFNRNYERLVRIHFGEEEEKANSSTFLPLLAEFAALIRKDDVYRNIQANSLKIFKEINLQMWFEESDTEEILYQKNALAETGSTKHSINLPEEMTDYVAEIKEELDLFSVSKDFKANRVNLFILPLIACHHFRTNIPPWFWRRYINAKD